MKTTIELTDAVARRARRLAAEQGVTLRELVESGLLRELDARAERPEFRLREAAFKGNGLRAGAEDWASLRDRSYSGRGS